MGFNFATGQMEDNAPATPSAPVPAAPTQKFNFATGIGGSQVTAQPEQPASDYFAGTKENIGSIAHDPFNVKNVNTFETDVPDHVLGAFKDSWQNLKNNWNGYTAASDKSVGFAGKLGSTLKLVGAGAGILFSPITALFKGGEDFPVLGTVVKGIDTAFSAAGEGGSAVGQKIVDKLPISNEKDKQLLKEGVGDIFALAAQIALGKATDVVKTKLKGKYGAVDAQTIVDKAEDIAASHPDTPEHLAAKVERSKARVENPDTPIEQTKAEESAKTVTDINQYETPEAYIESQKNAEGMRPVEEGEVLPNGSTTKMDFGTGKTMTDAEFPKATQEKFKAEYQTGKKSKVGVDIAKNAIEEGLTKTFGDTAEYDPVTIKNQAERMAPLLEDPERLGRIARGEEDIPEGLRAGTFIKAVEDYATENKDLGLLRDLANSHLTSETSLHAQELRLLRERNPDSVVEKVKDIETGRKGKIDKVKGKKIKKETDASKKVAKKEAKFSLADADTLLKSLIC